MSRAYKLYFETFSKHQKSSLTRETDTEIQDKYSYNSFNGSQRVYWWSKLKKEKNRRPM